MVQHGIPFQPDVQLAFARNYYLRDTVEIARDLLGSILVRKLNHSILAVRIVETEAYLGFHDPASHSYRGMTDRNRPMFEMGGIAYVYFVYGMHHCFNVVTQQNGTPEAILIRAAEPLTGIQAMKENRGQKKNLLSGPAVLCEALKIDRNFSGHPLDTSPLWIQPGDPVSADAIETTTRIGIDYAEKAVDWKLRFMIRSNPFVSHPTRRERKNT